MGGGSGRLKIINAKLKTIGIGPLFAVGHRFEDEDEDEDENDLNWDGSLNNQRWFRKGTGVF